MGNYIIKMILGLVLCTHCMVLEGQSPIADPGIAAGNGIIIVMKEVGAFVREHGAKILEWTQKALQVINGVVRNYGLMEATYGIVTDIVSIYGEMVTEIGDHPDMEDKARYLAVLLAVSARGLDLLSQLTAVATDEDIGGLVMDDHNRIVVLKEIHKKAFRYRRMIKYIRYKIQREVFRLGVRRSNKRIIREFFKYN